MTDKEKRFLEKWDRYRKAFNVENLNDANDKTGLDLIINFEINIEDLQNQVDIMIEDAKNDGKLDPMGARKIFDIINMLTTQIRALQTTLGIDRATRQKTEAENIEAYIKMLKNESKNYIDQRIQKIYCPDCHVMVGRFIPVHKHTAYKLEFQCSQCKKMIKEIRKERDTLFDLPEDEQKWRTKHRAKIIPIKRRKEKTYKIREESSDNKDDIIIEAELLPNEIILNSDDSIIVED